MRAAHRTIPFAQQFRDARETREICVGYDPSRQERRSRRMAIAIGLAATVLLANGVVITSLF